MSEGVQNDELKTSVRRIEYDFVTRTGFLHMPSGCCTDMTGCIRVFQRIDPNVRAIYTFAGTAEDTVYWTHPPGNWNAATGRMDPIPGAYRMDFTRPYASFNAKL